jgi:hypothetical protein
MFSPAIPLPLTKEHQDANFYNLARVRDTLIPAAEILQTSLKRVCESLCILFDRKCCPCLCQRAPPLGVLITNKSRLSLVIDRDGEDTADLRLKLPVAGDPSFGGICQHRCARKDVRLNDPSVLHFHFDLDLSTDAQGEGNPGILRCWVDTGTLSGAIPVTINGCSSAPRNSPERTRALRLH